MKEFLENQSLYLWMPLLLAFGAGFYFSMPFEPNNTWILISGILFILGCIFKKHIFGLAFILCLLGGFLYATLYTHFVVDIPVLKYSMHNTIISGTVTDIDILSDKTKVMVSVPNLDTGVDRDANVKLTISDKLESVPSIGDKITAKVSLFPPAKIEAPNSFDYARWAYFNNLTATGFVTEYKIENHNTTVSINSLRNFIHKKANSFLTDGLVLGYKNSVPKSDKQIWTTAGIGHVWSISGFHITLIGGWLFILFYFICRSISFITKRVPARIVATICAWVLLFGYVCLSGAHVATMRAFLMTSLLFIALLLGRNAVSLRNICIAFLILFCVNPHFVTQAGFQLSFAAIFGLIWFFDDKKFDDEHKIKSYLYTAVATAFIATIFTLPFIATHFNYVPVYSLLGNVFLLPIFSVIIMPLVIVGTICALFGFHLFLNLGMDVYNFSLHIAQKIADMPSANLTMPYIPEYAFVLFILGFLFLVFIKPITDSESVIYRKLNYILFIVCILFGIGIIVAQQKPVFYVTPDHELVGMVYDGKLEFNKAKSANHYFAFDAFRKLNGEEHNDKNIRRKCPDGVCIYKSDKFTLAYIQKFVPLQKHIVNLCRDDNIDFIVSYFDISSPKCNHKILHNGFVIYKSGNIKYTPANRWWNNPHE